MKKYRHKKTGQEFEVQLITAEYFNGDHPNDLHICGVFVDGNNRTVMVGTNFGDLNVAHEGDYLCRFDDGSIHVVSSYLFENLVREYQEVK